MYCEAECIVNCLFILSVVPMPTVSVAPPSSPLYAGTTLSLTCTVTVESAVDVDVVVDITWERVQSSGDPITTISMATESTTNTYTDTLDIAILSSNDRAVNCIAIVRPTMSVTTIINSPQGNDNINIVVQSEEIFVEH